MISFLLLTLGISFVHLFPVALGGRLACQFNNFLEEISSLSHSIVFLYFLALITEEGFLISPCYSLELCIQMGISFLFSLFFASLLFTAICKTMGYSKSSSKREVYINTILPQERRQQENY